MPFATIDIGTNTTLMLIAENDGGHVQRIAEAHRITRLGEGVGKAQMLSETGMMRTLTCLHSYTEMCRQHGVTEIVAVGTSAMRRAKNAAEFIQRVKTRCGFDIRIISGDEEAELSYLSAHTDFGEDVVVMDLGGGSTEFIWMNAGQLHAQSINMGSVVLQDEFGRHDPLTAQDMAEIRVAVRASLTALPPLHAEFSGKRFVGIAGTATTFAAIQLKLAQYDHSQVHGTEVTTTALETILTDLGSCSIADRKKIDGLDPDRADVIYAGGVILLESLRHFGFSAYTASDHGVRWGLAYKHVSS